MARFNIRHSDSSKLVSNLRVSDLKKMAHDGSLKPNDRIRKEGHTTWHLASSVNGLVFLSVDVTSEISLTEPETEAPFKNFPSDDELNSSASAPQYGALEEIRDSMPPERRTPTSSGTFCVQWPDKREDGPFSIEMIETLISDGVIQHQCLFRNESEQPWSEISILGIQSLLNEFEVTWVDGRTDGPFTLSTIQQLVIDGFITKTCTFKHSEGIQFILYEKMNLIDASLTTPQPKFTSDLGDDSDLTSSPSIPNAKKQVNRKKQKTARRTGWFRRLVVKSVASIAIIGLVIGLGCWGIWSVMPESQREWATKKYEDIRSMFTDPGDIIANEATEQSEVSTSTNVGTSNTETIHTPSGQVKTVANISVPVHGPLWIHEDLKMPVLNSFVPINSTTRQTNQFLWQWSWTPQLLLAMPANPITEDIQLKAYYKATRFGKEEWNWFPENLSITRGIGRTNDNAPVYSNDSLRLLEVGDQLGIWNQTIDKTSLIQSWFNLDTYNKTSPFFDINDPNNYLSRIDEVSDGNILRIELGGNNYWAQTDFLQFKRDQTDRVTSLERFDSRGISMGEIFRFEYSADNTISKFFTHNLYSQNEYWTEWTPKYSTGKLTSLSGVGGDTETTAEYEYDSNNRIIFIHVSRNNERFSASFTYHGENNYWSEAILTGKEVNTNKEISEIEQSEIEKDLGMIRYEQSLIN